MSKRILSLVLALVMVLGTFGTVFAANTVEKDAAEFLSEAKILLGDDKGNLNLDLKLERRDVIVLLSRLMGEEKVASEFPVSEESPTWEDARTDSYYTPFFAWAEANKYFAGKTVKELAPRDAITAQDYAVVLLRALGYEADGHDAWKTALEDAKALGILADVTVENTTEITRGQMSVMTLNTLKTNVKDSTKTLAETLLIEIPVLDATKVVNVSSENLKEITVVFDGEVEPASAKTITNYKLDGATLTRASRVILSEDNSVATIQLRAGETLKNQRTYKLTVSNVNSLNAKYVLNDTVEFKPLDIKVPEVTNVESLGNRLVKVTFSEPVTKTTAESRVNYKLNGYVANGNLSLSADLKTVSIKLSSAMKIGENKLSVSNVEDFTGMKVINVFDRAFDVVEDKTAPASFVVNEATLEYAEIEFDEAIDPDSVKTTNVYWLDTNGRKVVSAEVYPLDANYKTYGVEFSAVNKLPARETTLYVEKAKDFSGNTAAKLSAVVTATVDIERPELKSIDFARNVNNDEYISGTNTLDLTFSKAVDLASLKGANRYNVTVKDSNGKTVAVARDANVKHASLFPNTVVVDLTASLAEGKTYTVEVKNVIDKTYLKNMMIPVIETLVVPNISAPSVSSAYKDVNNLKVHVVFNKEMSMGGEGSVLDLNKYMIKVAGVWQLLPRNTEIEPGYDNKSVIIKFEEATVVTDIRVTLVEDAFGNKLAGLTQEKALTAPVNSDVVKAELVAKDKVAITFDKQLVNADTASFAVTNNSTNVKGYISYTVDGLGRGVVNIDLTEDVYSTKNLAVTITPADSKDIIGLPINVANLTATSAPVAIADKVAPVVALNNNYDPVISIANNVYDGANYLEKVSFEYTEELKTIGGVTPETAANDFVIYADYVNNAAQQMIAGVDYKVTTAANSKLVTIEFITHNPGVKEISIKTAGITKYITDMSGNSIDEVEVFIELVTNYPGGVSNK